MSLREEAVEAMGRARYARMVDRMVAVAAANEKLMILPEWDQLDDEDRTIQSETAAMYLDVLLDYLEASADEWIEAEFTAARQNDPLIVVPLRKVDTSSLLSVLREDT
jgi:hypothetical protein